MYVSKNMHIYIYIFIHINTCIVPPQQRVQQRRLALGALLPPGEAPAGRAGRGRVPPKRFLLRPLARH